MLYSQRLFHEVEIPLFFQEGGPFVKASWSGRQIACLVDTGAGIIMWPQWLHLDTQQLHISQTPQWPNGVTTQTEWMLTPRIEVGDLALTDIPTQAIGVPRPKPSDQFTYPTLGMEAFTAFVMTLDYRGKRLLLWDPNYDVTRRPHTANSRLIPYKKEASARVMLPGTLAGHKATFSLDTGSDGIYVSSSFAQKYLSFVPNEAAFRNGGWPVLHNLSGTVSGLPFRGMNVYIMKRANGPDVLLGSPFFSQYRVTIDRFRWVILVEKNG